MPLRVHLPKLLTTTLLAFGVALVVAGCGRLSVFQDVQLWTYDFLVNHGGYAPQSSQLVYVDFDDATFAAIGQYPIPRNLIAEVINQVSSASPRVIALDLLLSEPRTAGEDESMRQALTRAGNVIIASQSRVGDLPGVKPLPAFCQPENPDLDSGFCREGTPGALGYAFVNMPVDRDGFIRRFLLFSYGPSPSLSFPVMAAQQFAGEAIQPDGSSGIRFRGRRIAYENPRNKAVLVGRWNPEPARSVSALSLLHNQADVQQLFHEKLVLIGQGSDAARDRHLTPLFRPARGNASRLRMPGTQIHATAIETLLSGQAIKIVPNTILWVLNLLLFFAAIWCLLRFPLRYGLLTSAGLLVAAYVIAQSLFTAGHLWLRFFSTELGLALCVPFSTAYQYLQERFLHSEALAEREQVMGLFSRYVSPEVAQQIWERRSELVLAGEERTATVLFSDIRSFTAMTAGKPSQVVLQWLNEYLTAMDEVITAEGGFLNKFIGDGLMVLFGVPLSNGIDIDAARAVRCAQRMIQRVNELNHKHTVDGLFPRLKIGVGIHTGKLTCGNIGSAKRLEYSVIGETVNLASRLESLTKEFHSDIVMSESTYLAVCPSFSGLRDLGASPVRGFDHPIRLYSISAEADQSLKDRPNLPSEARA
jgi:adenylate cyclase